MALDLAFFVGLYLLYFFFGLRKQGWKRIILKTLFWFYIAVVLLLTVSPMQVLMSGKMDFSLDQMNFYVYQYNLDEEIIGNILLFIPFGFLLPLAYPKLKLWTILILVASSVTIEILQQSVGRVSDLTDIANNSLGGIAGFYGYVIISYIGRWLSRNRHPSDSSA